MDIRDRPAAPASVGYSAGSGAPMERAGEDAKAMNFP